MFVSLRTSPRRLAAPVLGMSTTRGQAAKHTAAVHIPTSKQVGIVSSIEREVSKDEGGRGIAPLVQHGDLLSAAMDLTEAQTVAIITGFPCLVDSDVPQETDGPLGAMAIARAVVGLGHDVVLLIDDINAPIMQACLDTMIAEEPGGKKLCESISLESFPGGNSWGAAEDARLDAIAHDLITKNGSSAHGPSHVLTIERAGPSATGAYLTMSAKDMTHLLAPLDRLVSMCGAHGVRSTGVGDGGNEVGMGKVYADVHANIKNGQQIACVTKTTNLVVASVSNWGGYAVSAAMGVLAGDCSEKVIVSSKQEAALCQAIVMAGAGDGVTGKCELSIDGMSLDRSLEVLQECTALATGSV